MKMHNHHGRRSIRLKDYDYTQAGAYFITLRARNAPRHRYTSAQPFGEITDAVVHLNHVGKIVRSVWQAIPDHFPRVTTDEFVIMPDHFHGILMFTDAAAVRATHASPVQQVQDRSASGPPPRSLGAVIGSFKSAATRRINEFRGTPGMPVWQRNYYEHIIRNEESLNRIRQYILDNPAKWEIDRESPQRQ